MDLTKKQEALQILKSVINDVTFYEDWDKEDSDNWEAMEVLLTHVLEYIENN